MVFENVLSQFEDAGIESIVNLIQELKIRANNQVCKQLRAKKVRFST